jgi:hypothetical protein
MQLRLRWQFWLVLVLMLVLGVIVPNVPWTSISKSQSTNPLVKQINDESARVAPWIELDDTLSSIEKEVDNRTKKNEGAQLRAFTAANAAEARFVEWVRAHRPGSLEEMNRASDGRPIYVAYLQAASSSRQLRLYDKALQKASEALPDLRHDTRKGFVERSPDGTKLASLRSQLQQLKTMISPGNGALLAQAKKDAETEVKRTFYETLPSPPR